MDDFHAMRRLLWLCAGRSLSFLNDEPSCIAIGLIGQQGGGRGPGRPLVLTGTLTDLTGGRPAFDGYRDVSSLSFDGFDLGGPISNYQKRCDALVLTDIGFDAGGATKKSLRSYFTACNH